jgi:outer membrane protein assembly factor BamA
VGSFVHTIKREKGSNPFLQQYHLFLPPLFTIRLLMGFLKKIYQCCLFICIATAAAAQNIDVSTSVASKLTAANKDSAEKVLVRQINIVGSKRTKEFIIRREIQIKPGDSILVTHLNAELQKARQQVYNTNLFNEVTVDIEALPGNEINIEVRLKERWYIFPIPKFQLVDRNINEWLKKYNGDLDRVVYGLKFTHYNLTGRRDLLRFTLLNGFTRNYSFTYTRPLSNKALTNGFSFSAGYVQNREFIYKISADNKPLLFNNSKFSRKTTYISAGYNIRKNILGTHSFNITYSHAALTDSITKEPYNPNYFNPGNASKSFIDLSYTYQYINANNAVYPLKGTIASVKMLKRGLGFTGGVNMLFVEGSYNKYWDFTRAWYGSLQFLGKVTLPFKQPYINQRALGYNDINLRGLELYVVDGVAYGLITLYHQYPLADKIKAIPKNTFYRFRQKLC